VSKEKKGSPTQGGGRGKVFWRGVGDHKKKLGGDFLHNSCPRAEKREKG